MHCRLQAVIDEHNRLVSDGAPGVRLTQRRLADLTGIAVTTVNRLAQDTAVRIDYATIERLGQFFDCEVSDLLVFRSSEPGDPEQPKGDRP